MFRCKYLKYIIRNNSLQLIAYNVEFIELSKHNLPHMLKFSGEQSYKVPIVLPHVINSDTPISVR